MSVVTWEKSNKENLMEDIFSRITAMILGCILMFIVPVRMMSERQKNMLQTYIFAETVSMVDSVCNKGILYDEGYKRYVDNLNKTNELYDIFMEHYSGEEAQFTRQIMASLNDEGCYRMKRGDLFKVKISDKAGNMLVFYGGCIKDEDY